jgi:hypothetical protein
MRTSHHRSRFSGILKETEEGELEEIHSGRSWKKLE